MLDREEVCGTMLKPVTAVARVATIAREVFIFLRFSLIVLIIVSEGLSEVSVEVQGYTVLVWNIRAMYRSFSIFSHRWKTRQTRTFSATLLTRIG